FRSAIQSLEETNSHHEESILTLENQISSATLKLPQLEDDVIDLQEKVDKVPAYAPITMRPDVEFFGDSITAGAGVPGDQRYSTLLCAQHGWTEHNHAVSASVVHDCVAAAFNNHQDDRDAVVNVGFN